MQPGRQTLDLIFYSPIFQEHKSLVCSFTLRAGGDSLAVSRYLFRPFLHRSYALDKKTRVCGISSQRVVGVKNGALFVEYGAKRAKPSRGVWGHAPQNRPNL